MSFGQVADLAVGRCRIRARLASWQLPSAGLHEVLVEPATSQPNDCGESARCASSTCDRYSTNCRVREVAEPIHGTPPPLRLLVGTEQDMQAVSGPAALTATELRRSIVEIA
jgi:hypothetical protein